jgi:hypothetical protein
MKLIRSAYFWLFLGSIAFIAFMDWTSSIHVTQKEWDAMAAERGEDSSPPRFGPFWDGFATACIIAGAWAVVYRQKHPKSQGELKRDDSD